MREDLGNRCIPIQQQQQQQRSSISSGIVESYDNKTESWVPLEYLLSSSKETTDIYDTRYHPYQQSQNRFVPRQHESRGGGGSGGGGGPIRGATGSGVGGVGVDGESQELDYIETVISSTPHPSNCPRKRSDSNSSSNSSSSAMTTISTNSNDLLRKLRRSSITTNSASFVFDLAQAGDDPSPSNPRDHYMVPTRNPRELNERILSLFNPQFLPNFNDMVRYMAASQQEPPGHSRNTNSRSINAAETRLFRSTNNRRRKRNSINESMLFRQGLVYQVPRGE